MTDALQVVRLQPAHANALAQLFETIACDEDAHFFHPHAFDARTAKRICSHTGHDLYFAIVVGGRFEGYGMLRGFDEGFAIPSLGIYVARALRGRGAARVLMEHMHSVARQAGAPSIYLKVYPDNVAAVRLYESLGYVFEARLDSSGQRVGRFLLNTPLAS